MIESNITKEDAYFRAFTILNNDIINPDIVMQIFNTEVYDMQLKYWKTHGFQISKNNNIKKLKDKIEYLKLDSLINRIYSGKIYFYESILEEMHKLEQKDFNY